MIYCVLPSTFLFAAAIIHKQMCNLSKLPVVANSFSSCFPNISDYLLICSPSQKSLSVVAVFKIFIMWFYSKNVFTIQTKCCVGFGMTNQLNPTTVCTVSQSDYLHDVFLFHVIVYICTTISWSVVVVYSFFLCHC